jgi:hypothetical protein
MPERKFGERWNDGKCAICGELRPKGRGKYCSDTCAHQGHTALRRQSSYANTCVGCGGPKDRGGRGVKLCSECKVLADGAVAEYQRQVIRLERAAKIKEAQAAGEPVKRGMPPVDGHKWCPQCQDYRPLDMFASRYDKKEKRAAYCKPCTRSYNRKRRLEIIYGLTQEEFDFLMMCQDYRCAICGGKPRKYMLSVDHDHDTGEVRGLLCSRCNHKLLGSANDDPERLRKAADYLESHLAREVFGEPKYAPGKGGKP